MGTKINIEDTSITGVKSITEVMNVDRSSN